MPEDEIQRLIYRVEMDDAGYVRGIESLSASTQKFSQAQEQANQKLKANETELKTASDITETARKRLEQYTGTNEKYRLSLELNLKKAQDEQARLNNLVIQSRKDYEAATKAAQDFANTSQRAANLQPAGGKIPVPTVAAPPQAIPPIIPPIAFEDFDLSEILKLNIDEFDKLRIAIGLAEARMASLNAEDEEFKQLAPLVEKGKEALQQFDNASQKVAVSQGSIREQLRRGREELVRLEQAGQGATEQYFQLEKQVAKLTDQFQDQQQRIRILASDTKLLDFGKGAITAATSAFQAYTAVSILAGDQSEELQKKTMQLFAAMQLLQSLEQLSNLTRREGVLSTLALSGATSVYNTVVGTTTGALRTFRLALLGTGIGAAVIAIGFLVKKYIDWKNAIAEANAEQKALQEINEKAIDSYAAQVTSLTILKNKLSDLTVPEKERIALAVEYNKTADAGNTINVKQIENIDLLNSAIDRQIAKIKERALAEAAASAASEKASVFLKAQAKLVSDFPSLNFSVEQIDKFQEQLRQGTLDITQFTKQQHAEFIAAITSGDLKALINSKKEFDQFTKIAAGVALPTPPPPTGGGKGGGGVQAIKDDFEQRKKALQEAIKDLQQTEFDTEIKVRKEFADKLKAAIDDINKDKGLKPAERKELISLTTTLNTGELDKALEDLRKKRIDAQNKLNDELKNLEQKNTQDRINLLQDEFQRRKELIDFNEQKELQDAQDAQADRIAALDLNRLLIGEQAYQDAKADIISKGEQQALLIQQRFAQQRQDLAADTFQKLLKAYDDAIFQSDLVRDKQILADLQVQLRLYQAGKISFEEFQKAITKIQKDAIAEREAADLQTEKNKLAALDNELSQIEDKYSEHYKNLKKQRDDLEKDITTKETKAVTDTPDPNTKQVETINDYVTAVAGLADAVVQFWAKANEAERNALDRSIAIQTERVNAAQRIAERGNAQYLKAEEDRLNELQIKRENAARRQLAIDAALQASQILVGITGAISKIATPGIGAAEVIAEIAIIVAALATGYGLVKSLQGNQPRLKEGTPYLQREGHKPGVDTIPAWLTEGEAVIPQEKNKKYKKSVEAIYHGKVPADVLNEFVENYVNKNILNEKQIKSDTKNNTVVNRSTSNIDNNSVSNKSVNTYNNFVENIKKIPAKVLETFIEKQYTEKVNKYSSEVLRNIIENYEHSERDNINNERVNKVSERTIKDLNKSVSIEHLNKFIDTHHTIKPVPLPDYQRIKEVAEIKLSHDGKLAGLIVEQNKKLDENTEVNKQVLRAMKTMGIHFNWDKNGVELSLMEALEKREKDKKS